MSHGSGIDRYRDRDRGSDGPSDAGDRYGDRYGDRDGGDRDDADATSSMSHGSGISDRRPRAERRGDRRRRLRRSDERRPPPGDDFGSSWKESQLRDQLEEAQRELEVRERQLKMEQEHSKSLRLELELKKKHCDEFRRDLELAETDLAAAQEDAGVHVHRMQQAQEASRRNSDMAQQLLTHLNSTRGDVKQKALQISQLKSALDELQDVVSEAIVQQEGAAGAPAPASAPLPAAADAGASSSSVDSSTRRPSGGAAGGVGGSSAAEFLRAGLARVEELALGTATPLEGSSGSGKMKRDASHRGFGAEPRIWRPTASLSGALRHDASVQVQPNAALRRARRAPLRRTPRAALALTRASRHLSRVQVVESDLESRGPPPMMSRRSTRIAQQQLKEESRKIDLQMFAREEGKRPSACSSDAGLSPSALDALGLSPGLRDRQSSSGSSEDQEELRRRTSSGVSLTSLSSGGGSQEYPNTLGGVRTLSSPGAQVASPVLSALSPRRASTSSPTSPASPAAPPLPEALPALPEAARRDSVDGGRDHTYSI